MIILRLALFALGHAPALALAWWITAYAGYGYAGHIIATAVWSVILTAGVRGAMRLSFATAHLLDAVGMWLE